MSVPFKPHHGLVLVSAEIVGPTGSAFLQLALDTGATSTLVNAAPLVAVGYDPALAANRVQVTTGSGVEFVPQISVIKIRALQQEQTTFPVLCHTLPPSASVDGLLGLDFMRGRILTIDFQTGQIHLS